MNLSSWSRSNWIHHLNSPKIINNATYSNSESVSLSLQSISWGNLQFFFTRFDLIICNIVVSKNTLKREKWCAFQVHRHVWSLKFFIYINFTHLFHVVSDIFFCVWEPKNLFFIINKKHSRLIFCIMLGGVRE